jgi:acyl dehydratase
VTDDRLDRAGVGRWTAPVPYAVTREAIIAYARAINDEEPAHLAGEVAPPVFAVTAAFGALDAASRFLASDEVYAASLHGSQDIRLHAALRPGITLSTRAAPLAIAVRGNGTTVVLQSQTRDEAGALLNTQYMSLYFPGWIDGANAGEPPPAHRLEATSAAPTVIALPVDPDQPRRFAAASGDHNPMHLDDGYARAAGFPGVILHGLCTMAFCGRAVIRAACPGSSQRLRRLALRFSRPVFPGQVLTTTIRRAGDPAGVHAYVFEAATSPDTVVIRDGLAEVANIP